MKVFGCPTWTCFVMEFHCDQNKTNCNSVHDSTDHQHMHLKHFISTNCWILPCADDDITLDTQNFFTVQHVIKLASSQCQRPTLAFILLATARQPPECWVTSNGFLICQWTFTLEVFNRKATPVDKLKGPRGLLCRMISAVMFYHKDHSYVNLQQSPSKAITRNITSKNNEWKAKWNGVC